MDLFSIINDLKNLCPFHCELGICSYDQPDTVKVVWSFRVRGVEYRWSRTIERELMMGNYPTHLEQLRQTMLQDMRQRWSQQEPSIAEVLKLERGEN